MPGVALINNYTVRGIFNNGIALVSLFWGKYLK